MEYKNNLIKELLNNIKNYNFEEFFNKLIKITDLNLLNNIKKNIDIVKYSSYFNKYDMIYLVFEYYHKDTKKLINHFNNTSKNESKKIHILSDIDDTIFTSFLGGLDKSYTNNKFYPEIKDIFKILHKKTNYVTFLSARPEYFVSDDIINLKYNVLSGSVTTIVDGIKSIINKNIFNSYDLKSYSHIYNNKLDSYKKYKLIYPEYKFIFFGDLGQADILLADDILKDPEQIVVLKDVYMNNNIWISKYLKKYIDKLKLKYNYRIFFVKTYSEFILKLYGRFKSNQLNPELFDNLLNENICYNLLKKFKSNIKKMDDSIYKNEVESLLNINF
jgi:hypothetical protein